MAKNILIFSDGTGQAGGLKPEQRLSNIYKLYRATKIGPDSIIDPQQQVAYYDAGIGSDLDDKVVRLSKFKTVWKFFSMATGTGISRNIADCYEYILKVYEPGDRIYLFGFSRGAYTVRCLGGVLGLCGVPITNENGEPLTKYGNAIRQIAKEAVNKVYLHGADKGTDKASEELKTFKAMHAEHFNNGAPLAKLDAAKMQRLQTQSENDKLVNDEYRKQRKVLAARFRKKYSSEVNDKANAVPYFIGVFDTVAALGATGLLRKIFITIAMAAFFGTVYLVNPLVSRLSDLNHYLSFTTTSVALGLLGFMVYIWFAYRRINDYPNLGEHQWHIANFLRFEFYDKSLNEDVYAARHALAIDESRKDFTRVKWGNKGITRPAGEPEWMKQIWFPGCHSDIGGSYPEDESRLSDVALKWMLDEVMSLPHPIKVDNSKLNLYPDPLGLMHDELILLEEKIQSYLPSWWPKNWIPKWDIRHRIEASEATHHPSVGERIRASVVSCCGRFSNYTPEALRLDSRYPELKKK